MLEEFVDLTSSADPVQRSLIEDVLREAGIPFTVTEGKTASVVIGSASPLVTHVYRVPDEKLQTARDVLCENSIVCEISERLLRRTFNEVVKPLLGKSSPNLDRLVYLVTINNKETVHALFKLTLTQEGGRGLLEDLFFRIAAEDLLHLRSLARVLAGKPSAEFPQRFLNAVGTGLKEARANLYEVLKELPFDFPKVEALARGLRDADPEVRAAAGEALFTLRRTDYGFDPDAPEAEREAAIELFLETPGLE